MSELYDKAVETALERGEDPKSYLDWKTTPSGVGYWELPLGTTETTTPQEEDALQRILRLHYETLQAHIPETQVETCDECGHDVSLHEDKYGCQYERGDAWVDGEKMGGWVAQGPCGCKAIKFCENCGDYPCRCHNHICQQCDKVLSFACVCENPDRMDWCSSNCRAAFDL